MAADPQMYEGNDGKWYWRMTQDQNGKITSDGGQGFTTKEGCVEAYETNRKLIMEGPEQPKEVPNPNPK